MLRLLLSTTAPDPDPTPGPLDPAPVASPATTYESSGVLSTLTQEEDFWEQVADETDLTMTTAGLTHQNRPIWRLDLGNPTGPTLMLTTAQHANELAPREALMAWMRDLAYSTDPAILSYLGACRIVAVTPINADMVGTFLNNYYGPATDMWIGRNDTTGANLNRDHYDLNRPETRVMRSLHEAIGPDIVVDLHEVLSLGGGASNWMSSPGATPDPVLTEWHKSLWQTLKSACLSAGFTVETYAGPENPIPWNGTTSAKPETFTRAPQWARRLVFLSEVNWHLPLGSKITVQRVVLNALITWHNANRDAIAADVAASRAATLAADDILPVPGGVPVDGYQLDTALPQRFYDAWGIDPPVEGYVTLQQPARNILPLLLDPSSSLRKATATRVTP